MGQVKVFSFPRTVFEERSYQPLSFHAWIASFTVVVGPQRVGPSAIRAGVSYCLTMSLASSSSAFRLVPLKVNCR